MTVCILYGAVIFYSWFGNRTSTLEPLVYQTCLICEKQRNKNTRRIEEVEKNSVEVDLRCKELKVVK